MFYLFYGTDTVKARARMHAVLSGAQKNRPDAEVFTMNAERFSAGELEQFIGGMGLFEKKSIIILDRIFEKKDNIEIVTERLADMKETENFFLILEGSLDKKTLGKMEKFAFKIELFDKKEIAKPKFNVFGMADALGRRDKKELWVLYQKAQKEELAPEAISGMLFWKVKSLLTEYRPGKFSELELKKISSKLISMYHDAHRGLCDFDNELEKFILEI